MPKRNYTADRRSLQVIRSSCSSSSTLLRLLLLAVIISGLSHIMIMLYRIWSVLDANEQNRLDTSPIQLALEAQKQPKRIRAS